MRSLLAWVLLAIALQTGLTILSVQILSSVRAFVGGESFWSKAQKDAVLAITVYAQTADPAALASFRQAMAVIEADKKARFAMDRRPPDVETARSALLSAETDPADASGMIWLYRYFSGDSHIEKAIHHWRRGDELAGQLQDVCARLAVRLQSGPLDGLELKEWNRQIVEINDELRPEAAAFAYRLGDASRWVTGLLAIANGAIALLFGALLTWRFLALERAITARPAELETAMSRVSEQAPAASSS